MEVSVKENNPFALLPHMIWKNIFQRLPIPDLAALELTHSLFAGALLPKISPKSTLNDLRDQVSKQIFGPQFLDRILSNAYIKRLTFTQISIRNFNSLSPIAFLCYSQPIPSLQLLKETDPHETEERLLQPNSGMGRAIYGEVTSWYAELERCKFNPAQCNQLVALSYLLSGPHSDIGEAALTCKIRFGLTHLVYRRATEGLKCTLKDETVAVSGWFAMMGELLSGAHKEMIKSWIGTGRIALLATTEQIEAFIAERIRDLSPDSKAFFLRLSATDPRRLIIEEIEGLKRQTRQNSAAGLLPISYVETLQSSGWTWLIESQ